jgi:3-methyladenine DNA glycosylase AlkD
VVDWIDCLVSDYYGLDDRRVCVVEGFATLVKRNTNIDQHKLTADVHRQFNSITEPTTLNIRTLRRQFSKRIAELPAENVVQLAINLIESAIVPRFFAYELVQHHRAALRSLNSRTIKKLGNRIGNWAAVDSFACFLAGPVWREHQIPDSLIVTWAGSKDRWWRRAAVVSTVPLNNKTRGGRGDLARTLKICRLVVEDRDDMVVKALSWSLRELAKRDHLSVRAFVAEHEKRLAPRVLREVRNKLNTGLKNPKSK